nr:immunoglobulin heavy chain junction region [Mus musculus]MBK4196065.1 immunoglobulin heavy chain junction region [Mus musculus]
CARWGYSYWYFDVW